MAVEGAPLPTPGDVAAAVAIFKGAKKLFGGKGHSGDPGSDIIRQAGSSLPALVEKRADYALRAGGPQGKGLDTFEKNALAKVDARIAQLKTAQPRPPPPLQRYTPRPPPPARPPPTSSPPVVPTPPPLAPVIAAAPSAVISSGIPNSVGEIFKGTRGGRAIGKAKDVLAKGGRGGVIGVAVVAGIEATRAIIGARDRQIKEEDRIYRDRTRKEDQEINRRVDDIRRARERDLREEERKEREYVRRQQQADRMEERSRDRQATTVARIRKQLERADRDIERVGERRERNLKREVDRELKARAKAAKQAAAARAAKVKRWQQAAIGLLTVSRLLKQKRQTGGQSYLAPPSSPPPVVRPRPPPTVGRPVVSPPALGTGFASPDLTGVSFGSLSRESFLSPARSKTATKEKVRKCRTDTPKRKKGRCRSGFFRETPNRTTYKTWSERKCL